MLKSCASFHLSRTGVVSKQPSRDWTDERRRPDGNYSQAIEEICTESGKEGRVEPCGDEVGDGRRAGALAGGRARGTYRHMAVRSRIRCDRVFASASVCWAGLGRAAAANAADRRG